MSLNKVHKKIGNERLMKDFIKKYEQPLVARVSATCLAVTAMVLHDKYGFGRKRLNDVFDYVYDLFDSVYRDYCTLDDIKECLYNELNLDLGKIEKKFTKKRDGDKYAE